jgi:DNA-directed RNA polymerase sigma subunit (sigma70/sigma32)
MTKDEVFKFLDTAEPEVCAEIRAYMAEIVRNRNFKNYLDKNKARSDRIQRICELHNSGKTYRAIGEMYNISPSRVREIYLKEQRFRGIRGEA